MSETIRLMAEKLSAHFSSEDFDKSDIKKLLMSSKLESIDIEQRDKYFTFCELLVDILNYYLSTQNKIVKLFKENSYAVLEPNDIGWKDIVIKVKGDKDSKYIVNSIPVFIFGAINPHGVKHVVTDIRTIHKSINKSILRHTNDEYLENSLYLFFYDLIYRHKEQHGEYLFGSVDDLRIDLARKILIKTLRSNPFSDVCSQLDSNNLSRILHKVYSSVYFEPDVAVEDLREFEDIDKKSLYQEFVKIVGGTVFKNISLYLRERDYKHIDDFTAVLKIYTMDIYEIAISDYFNAEAYISEKINYLDKDVNTRKLYYKLSPSRIVDLINSYHDLLDMIPNNIDIKLKYFYLIGLIKSINFDSGGQTSIPRNPRGITINKLQQHIRNRAYNVIDASSLSIYLDGYSISSIDNIPSKELIKEMCGVEALINVLTVVSFFNI